MIVEAQVWVADWLCSVADPLLCLSAACVYLGRSELFGRPIVAAALLAGVPQKSGRYWVGDALVVIEEFEREWLGDYWLRLGIWVRFEAFGGESRLPAHFQLLPMEPAGDTSPNDPKRSVA